MGRDTLSKNEKSKRKITSFLEIGSIYELKVGALFKDTIHGWKLFEEKSVLMLLEYDLNMSWSDKKHIITMKFLNPEGRISLRTDFDENIYSYLQLKK